MKIGEKMKKYLGFRFSTGTVAGDDYKSFERKMRNNLKKQASEVNMELHRFLKNHYEFSAVLHNPCNGRFVYLSIPDVRFEQDRWYKNVLIRSMMHDNDWRGGINRYCAWCDVGTFAKEISENDKYYK